MAKGKEIAVLVAQFPVSLNIQHNLKQILAILANAQAGDLVVLPEGAVSGYVSDASFLGDIDTDQLDDALQTIQNAVVQHQLYLVVGSCLRETGVWSNSAIYYGPRWETFIYHKVNLAPHERGYFSPGSQLRVLTIQLDGRPVKVGIQLCREIRYPEQWRYLARAGAQLFCYLANAAGDDSAAPVWRSHLISRAAENQRFVLAANSARPGQMCPSMIVDPRGAVRWEAYSSEVCQGRVLLDGTQISNRYLDQARHDIVRFD